MRKYFIAAAAVILVLLLTNSCFCIFTQNGYIEIINTADPWDITEVYISASDLSEWGDNQLGVGNRIYAETSRTFTVLADTYDVQIVDDFTPPETFELFGITVNAGGTVTLEYDGGTFTQL